MNGARPDFENLLAAVIDGSADEAQLRQFQALLRADAELRAEYASHMRVHAFLQWRAGSAPSKSQLRGTVIPMDPAPPVEAAGENRRRWPRWRLAAAAAILAGLGAAFWLPSIPWLRNARPPENAAALEVLEAEGVATPNAPGAFNAGAQLKLSELRMLSGRLRFRLDSGAVVTVNGPADIHFLGSMRLRVNRGKVTADVSAGAKGFIVETAQAKVVDLGTKFGVDVADAGNTDVVVFQGRVNLFDRDDRHPRRASMTQLVEGEAVRVDARRQVSRIVNVTGGAREDEWASGGPRDGAAVISSVRDNLRSPSDKYFYRILPGGLKEDARAFIGQRHEWNGLDASGMPPWLTGADLVQTFVNDHLKTTLEITVTVSRPAAVYVFFDERSGRPSWLAQRFTDTGLKIGLENAPSLESGKPVGKGPGVGNMAPLSVWRCELPQAGSVTLGPVHEASDDMTRRRWMYGIAAKALPDR